MPANATPSCSAPWSSSTTHSLWPATSAFPSRSRTVASRWSFPGQGCRRPSSETLSMCGAKEEDTPMGEEHPPWRLRSIARSAKPRHLEGLWSARRARRSMSGRSVATSIPSAPWPTAYGNMLGSSRWVMRWPSPRRTSPAVANKMHANWDDGASSFASRVSLNHGYY